MRASSCATSRRWASSSLAVRASSLSSRAPKVARRASPPTRTSSIGSSFVIAGGGGPRLIGAVARAEKKENDDRFDPDAAPSFADSEFAGVATALAFVAVFGGALALLLSLAKPVIDNTLNSIPVR